MPNTVQDSLTARCSVCHAIEYMAGTLKDGLCPACIDVFGKPGEFGPGDVLRAFGIVVH